ncbi:MAG: NAD(P)-binding domain-containing protein [Granulosicoccaceae bacterium]
MNTFGVIGAGHLASYTIAAMRTGGFTGEIVLSPRGAATGKAIASNHDCKVMLSNQAVAAAADIVLLAVRPADWVEAVKSVTWQARHILLSAVSGVTIKELQKVANINNAVRIMPSSFIEFGNPFIPAFPHNDKVAQLFGEGCPIVSLASEQQLDESMIMSCAYAWQFGLMQQMQDWFVGRGWEPAIARDMVMRHWRGAVDATNGCPQVGFTSLLDGIATPGTYTRLGFEALAQAGGLDALGAALSQVNEQLRSHT